MDHPHCHNVLQLRVRYSETDQLGTFYNSRVFEWFECGRTELLRQLGIPYAQMEQRGAHLPLIEAHAEYQGRARYDDLLEITTTCQMSGKARLRFEMKIINATTKNAVAEGHTIHAITDAAGKPIRPPTWLSDALTVQGKEDCPFCHGQTCKGSCRD